MKSHWNDLADQFLSFIDRWLSSCSGNVPEIFFLITIPLSEILHGSLELLNLVLVVIVTEFFGFLKYM